MKTAYKSIITIVLVSLLVSLLTTSLATPVSAQDDFTITVGEDKVVIFTEFNYHDSWFEDDPNNPEPWPDQREARSDGNIAYVSLSATPDHAGVARSRVGVDFEWDLGPYTWEEVKNWPVKVIIDFSYHIEAYWAAGNGSANAGVSVDGFLGPCFDEAGYDLIGYETGHSGSRGDTVSETYQTTVEGLEDLGRRIALQACCQAHSVADGTSTHHSSAEVQISSIKIEILNPPIAIFTYTPEKPMVGGNITFNASDSSDPDGEIVEYEWDFDGNITSTGNKVIKHIYEHPKNIQSTLTVTDNDGLKNSTSKDIDLSLKTGDLLLCRSPWSRVPGEWTHVGMYVEEYEGKKERVVEAVPPIVKVSPLTDWSFPYKTYVEALRVRTTDDIRRKAANFALRQEDKPYILTLLSKNATDESSWYCSELVWAAYKNQGVDIENGPDRWAITPTEIHLDDDTEVIGWHKEHRPWRFFIITLWSPADLNVTDPDGLSINKESIEISGAIYGEDDLDDDGEPDDWIGIPEQKLGDYLIQVIPEPDAEPTDTYTLEVSTEDTTTVLAENVPISEIPEEPYVFESTTRMCGDVNCDGKVTMSDVRKVFNRYLDPNYPLDLPWAADVNCDGKVTMSDVRKVFNRYLDPGYELNCCCGGVG